MGYSAAAGVVVTGFAQVVGLLITLSTGWSWLGSAARLIFLIALAIAAGALADLALIPLGRRRSTDRAPLS
ncbi:hypothetical protein [Dactylosporangium sp. NPDC051541]|uniref:hypothetical protein n=1 Tax=Dactylosporangium sp. NPDC051541 TaxID=3363977 RepID=UPI0037A24F1C